MISCYKAFALVRLDYGRPHLERHGKRSHLILYCRVSLLLAAMFLLLGVESRAQGWKGIYPVDSSRADVVHHFGVCGTDPCQYDFKEQNVIITYVVGQCHMQEGQRWNIAPDKVLSIVVYPKQAYKIKELEFTLSEFAKRTDPELPGIETYVNEIKGISVVVDQGRIIEIRYYPSKVQKEKYGCSPKNSGLLSDKHITR